MMNTTKTTKRGAGMSRSESAARILAAAVAVLAVLLVPSVACASFTRPFLRQITRAEAASGLECQLEASPCLSPHGVAVDEANHLWVGDATSGGNSLDEFEPAENAKGEQTTSKFIQELPLDASTAPDSVAIERSTGRLYITGSNHEGSEHYVEVFSSAGVFVEQWTRRFPSPSHIVAGPTANVIYVSEAGSGHALVKLNSKGEEVAFSASEPYIKGAKGGEIVGTPPGLLGGCGAEKTFESFTNLTYPGELAVDAAGDIYVVTPKCESEAVVLEYRAGGEFVRSINVAEAPIPGETPGAPEGVAVDPVSGHVLVAVGTDSKPPEGWVDEFDGTTGKFLDQMSEVQVEVSPGVREPQRMKSAGELAGDGDGDVYVVDFKGHAVDVFGPGRFLPTLTVGEAGGVGRESVVLGGSVNPEGFKLTECVFEYVPQGEFEHEGFTGAGLKEVSCSPSAAAINATGKLAEAHPVTADVAGLASGTTYEFRLVASSEGALGGTAASSPLGFTALHAPVVLSSSVSNLSSTFVDLAAQIDPDGAGTRYHFEYDTTPYTGGEQHGVSVPAGGVAIGAGGPSGSSPESVLQHLSGLQPGTSYHFRVVAENEIEGKQEVTDGPDEVFATLPALEPGLPDGRAYELVTPAVKQGGSDLFAVPPSSSEFENKDVGAPSQSGEGFLLETFAAFGPFPSAGHSAYVFRREPGGWGYASLASPTLGLQSINETVFDPGDLSRVAVNDNIGAAAGEGGSRLTSLTGPPAGPYTSLHADPPHHASEGEHGAEGTQVVGGSRDLGVLILESQTREGQTNDACGVTKVKHGAVLCEWAGGYEEGPGGEPQAELKLVDTNSEGSLPGSCGATLGASGTGGAGTAHDACLESGGEVFFTAPDPFAKGAGLGCWEEKAGVQVNPPQLYLRADGHTIKLSAPEAGVKEGGKAPAEYPAAYVGASEDGSKVFFLTETELTNEAVKLGLHDKELYECEITIEAEAPGCRLTRISAGAPGYQAAFGTGSLSAATGTGTLTKGSEEVAEVLTSAGSFAVGQDIAGPGISAGTTITAVGAGTLSLSDPATLAGSAAVLQAGSPVISELTTSAGAFAVGREIEGAGIPAGATITQLSAGTLTLSAPATLAGSAVVLHSNGPHLLTVPAVAAQGSAVYFTAFGALASGAPPQPNGGSLVNLYHYDTTTNITSYVTTVNETDFPSTGGCSGALGLVAVCSVANWYTTPDGRFLLFATTRELKPGYSTTGPCRLPNRQGEFNGHCDELYRYDASDGSLVCVSCNPGGAAPVSNAEFARSAPRTPASAPVRAMTNEGAYVFFDTADALVPQDSNNTLDVYEWHEGKLALISSGSDPAPSFLLGTSPYTTPGGETIEAGNIFIGTHANLVPSQDTESQGNIFDARICLPEDPCIPPPAGETAPCQDGSCQIPPPAPGEPIVKSFGWSYGVGNITPGLEAPLPPKPTAAQIRAKQLAAALKLCKKDRSKKKRANCERTARRRYGAPKPRKARQ